MIARLVGFDTTSRNSNLELIGFVKDYLASHGVESSLVPNETGDKASLFATIGPKDAGGIALSGHTDCVPVDGQGWSSDPFTVTEKDRRLYGRGTCDMKGFVAIALAMVPEFLSRPLSTPIHLALSYDEEVGCTGVRPMIGELGAALPKPRAVIVGEPTEMAVVDAHKTITDYLTEVTGHEVHSAHIDKGANSILAAAELLGEIARMRDDMIAAGDPSGRFEPAYTTVHVGQIWGGTAHNIVPLKCRFEWEVRSLPGVDPDDLLKRLEAFGETHVLPQLRRIAPTTGISTVRQVDVIGLAPDPGSLAETLAMRCAGSNETRTVAYATEGGLFQARDIPTIVCGPGSISQAHQPDEYIEISQVEACVAFMRRLADAARAGI
ncbi:acetylornithine deacetylase [Microbaculum marinum]|uniref:Acetylornithine deacetylase n=1 Tax=Microbaculum marinum TaxID=1764581 RepID=A0AAW9RRR1_9HYPH